MIGAGLSLHAEKDACPPMSSMITIVLHVSASVLLLARPCLVVSRVLYLGPSRVAAAAIGAAASSYNSLRIRGCDLNLLVVAAVAVVVSLHVHRRGWGAYAEFFQARHDKPDPRPSLVRKVSPQPGFGQRAFSSPAAQPSSPDKPVLSQPQATINDDIQF